MSFRNLVIEVVSGNEPHDVIHAARFESNLSLSSGVGINTTGDLGNILYLNPPGDHDVVVTSVKGETAFHNPEDLSEIGFFARFREGPFRVEINTVVRRHHVPGAPSFFPEDIQEPSIRQYTTKIKGDSD